MDSRFAHILSRYSPSVFCKTVIVLTIVMFSMNSEGQIVNTFRVTTSGKEKLAIPVKANLDAFSFLPDSMLQLVEWRNGKELPVASQVEGAGSSRIIHWLVEPSAAKQRAYRLVKKGSVVSSSINLFATISDGVLTLGNGTRKFVAYNFKTVYPPAGVDTAYKRSGFIHPLYTPNGKELTRINAPDHYHHWGLWNPWTRVLFEKDTLDFWNLRDRKGTVRFAGFSAIEKGPVYTGYSALHEHIAFKSNGTSKVAINELQTVRVYNPGSNTDQYMMDVTVQLSCASESPVTLLEYRYGGIGVRATESWTRDNSEVFTSEGKSRKEADGSMARWCVAQGDLGGDYGGLEMMSYPANYNHPEPLRIWPENSNGRGDVFLNFSPTKNKDWVLEPGKTYVLKYRFLVFNNKLSKETAEEAWQSFAKPTLK